LTTGSRWTPEDRVPDRSCLFADKPVPREGISRCNQAQLLSDNGSSYISSDLATWLEGKSMTQGKIERWHQTLKNRILLENYFVPGELEAQIESFVAHYNHQRYHESLSNLTPADVYFGRGESILMERERIKRQIIQNRRLQHQMQTA
jgi:putative transposase